MNAETKQALFEAILSSLKTHAPNLELHVAVATASDAALKLVAHLEGKSFKEGADT